MKRTRRTVEQIIRILREGGRGVMVEQVCRAPKVSAFEGPRPWRSGWEKT